METLVNDYRFTMYNMCYKRVLMCWITLAFCVLLALLFSGIKGILLFSLGVSWLFLNAVAIFVCMWAKMGLARGLEKCLARVNKMLMKHKIVIALDDRGNISCHKIHLCFIYFDPSQCVKWVNHDGNKIIWLNHVFCSTVLSTAFWNVVNTMVKQLSLAGKRAWTSTPPILSFKAAITRESQGSR